MTVVNGRISKRDLPQINSGPMKLIATYAFCLLALFMLFSCRTSKDNTPSLPPAIIPNTESVRTEYIETVKIDTLTISVPVPVESALQNVHDNTSHIETTLAESDAWINNDGTLGHSIRNKPQRLKAEVSVPMKESKTNNTAKSIKEIPVPYPYPVYVEKNLTLWQSIRLGAFWYLIGIAILALGWILRKPIVTVMQKLF